MKLLLLFIYFAYAQMGGFGNNPPMGGGFVGGPAISGFGTGVGMGMPNKSNCRPNTYAYHPEHGFGFFVEKTIATDPSPDSCLFYSIKLHGYPTVNRYGSLSASSCINSARCEKISNTEGKRIVSIACPPLNLNGQEVIGVHDNFNSNETVEILIRSQVPTAYTNQSKTERRDQIVRKSAYVTQTIDKKYLVDSALRNEKFPIVDLSDKPSEILEKIKEEEEGIYITSKCDPNAPGPVGLFDMTDIGPFGTGVMGVPPGVGGMGVPGGGGGMKPPTQTPGNGAR
jgi:hypothetical protein